MDDEIKKLLKQNLSLTQEIHTMVRAIKKHMLWQKIFSILKILIIVVPIVLGLMYLPPILKDITSQYKDLLGIGGGGQNIEITPELLNKFMK